MLHAPLARAYELTCSIAVAADQDDWQIVSQLVDERSPLIMALGPEQPAQALAAIREIQRIDAAVMQRANGAREALARTFSEAQQRVTAAQFYQKTGLLR
ncbi:MAG: flagellar protein FliT [Paraburkholderia sp.]|nr:flagellar protein FliT [Paraburkholderia sp.]